MKEQFGIEMFVVVTMLLLVFSSCEKTIPFEGENATPKLVLNSFFSADSTLKIHMSNSLGVVDDGDLADVTNANVILYNKNNQIVTTLNYQGAGNYESPFQPSIGELYTIRASADGFDEVSSSDQLLSKPSNLTIDSDINNAGDIFLTVVLEDNTLESNYYILDINTPTDSMQFFPDEIGFTVNGLILDNDPDETDDAGVSFYQELLFTDELNVGATRSFTIKIGADNNFGFNFSKLNVSLTSCTSNFYKYYRTLKLYQESDVGPFTEPVRVFSNIENGFGIFGGYNKVITEVDL